MEEFGRRLDRSSEKTIAIVGDAWPQTAKQDGDRISKPFLCSIWKKRNERPHVEGVSIMSSNGAPSRKGCVVNGQMTKANNKSVPPPPAPPSPLPPHQKSKSARHSYKHYPTGDIIYLAVEPPMQ